MARIAIKSGASARRAGPPAEVLGFKACNHKSAFCKRGSVNVRFAPKATEVLRCREASPCAKGGLMHRSNSMPCLLQLALIS